MAALPDISTVQYNGFTFPVYRKMDVQGRARKDDARRTVIGMDYRVRIEFWITPADYGNGDPLNADATMANIRKLLTKQGAGLTISNTGFGPLIVNQGGVVDMAFGPIPEIISWKSAGGNKSVFVTWECSTFVPECNLAAGLQGVVAFNLKTSFSTDKNRLTTMTRDGYLQIALTRRGVDNRLVFDTALNHRDLLQIPLIPGFTRDNESFRETLDHTRFDFSVVDVARSPNQLPWGCSEARGTHSVNNYGKAMAANDTTIAQGGNMLRGDLLLSWNGRINASYTVLDKFDQSIAYMHFLDLCKQIWQPQNQQGTMLLIRNFTASEGLYQENRRIEFSVDYFFNSSWNRVLELGGFNKVAPGTDGTLWNQKWLGSGYRTDTDLYALSYLGNRTDFIVDICQPNQLQVGETPTYGFPRALNGNSEQMLESNIDGTDSTWNSWHCGIEVRIKSGVVEHVILDDGEGTVLTSRNGKPVAKKQPKIGQPAEFPYFSKETVLNSKIQTSVPSQVRFILKGEALRTQFTITIPTLVSIKGKRCFPIRTNRAWQGMVRNFGGIIVYGAVWEIEYVCPDLLISEIPVPSPIRADLQNPNFNFGF